MFKLKLDFFTKKSIYCRVSLYEEREKSLECSVNPELEQMRTLLEEKDKHINDLTETLNNFHVTHIL